MQARIRLVVLVFLSLLSPALASAQQVNHSAASTTATAGPRVGLLTTGVRADAPADSAASLLQRSRQNVGKPVALMIVGGAAIVLGAVIGDDVGTLFMIGGAVALLIGLYQYLK